MATEHITAEYFAGKSVVDHYAAAAIGIGLWRSEEAVFRRYLQANDRILEVGTGTGRIALGLHELGYRHVLAIEPCRDMLERAQSLARRLEYSIAMVRGDATRLAFEDQLFDGAIFGFNGWPMIAGRANRRQALREIRRVVRPGGYFIFTTHDRALSDYLPYWEAERARWALGTHDPRLLEFGDRIEETEMGLLYIHVPSRDEVYEDLMATGWQWVADQWRHEIAAEPLDVLDFSDECRFWVARVPDLGAVGDHS
jgi:ubiquinone/menaquinone biosynthesis C-methylase UbiE